VTTEAKVTFSNPAAAAAAGASAYVKALLEVLGDRRPLEVLPELVPWIEARVRAVSPEALRRPEAPGKWSVTEVVQHLADSELVLGFRTRMILSEESPRSRATTRTSGRRCSATPRCHWTGRWNSFACSAPPISRC
jgi:hypothetical protein